MLAASSGTIGEITGLNTLNAPYLIFDHFCCQFSRSKQKGQSECSPLSFAFLCLSHIIVIKIWANIFANEIVLLR